MAGLKIEMEMTEHLCLFKHTGGGCNLQEVGNNCDDTYKCDCGAWFVVHSQEEVHFRLPKEIQGKYPPEPIEVNFDGPDANGKESL